MNRPLFPIVALVAMSLAGCATAPGPVEVTRFSDPARLSPVGQGRVFVESGVGGTDNSLELAPYKAAVAEELRRLGYGEAMRDGANYIATITVERYIAQADGRRSPVSVGVGGSTGSYGSGVGLGLGINLGGSQERLGSELRVVMRDVSTGQSVWEGRAEVQFPPKHAIAETRRNAEVLAGALFQGFPGNNGETVEVSIPK